MAKKPPRKSDRHKTTSFSLRLHETMLDQLGKLVERNYTDKTEEIRNAIRQYLEAHGFWPPPPGGKEE